MAGNVRGALRTLEILRGGDRRAEQPEKGEAVLLESLVEGHLPAPVPPTHRAQVCVLLRGPPLRAGELGRPAGAGQVPSTARLRCSDTLLWVLGGSCGPGHRRGHRVPAGSGWPRRAPREAMGGEATVYTAAAPCGEACKQQGPGRRGSSHQVSLAPESPRVVNLPARGTAQRSRPRASIGDLSHRHRAASAPSQPWLPAHSSRYKLDDRRPQVSR